MRDRIMSGAVETAAESSVSVAEDRLAELAFRREQSQRMGGPEALERQHRANRLNVRERIAALADEGSFREVGTLAGTGKYDENHRLVSVTPAPYVAGLAKIDNRPIALGGEDFTVRG